MLTEANDVAREAVLEMLLVRIEAEGENFIDRLNDADPTGKDALFFTVLADCELLTGRVEKRFGEPIDVPNCVFDERDALDTLSEAALLGRLVRPGMLTREAEIAALVKAANPDALNEDA